MATEEAIPEFRSAEVSVRSISVGASLLQIVFALGYPSATDAARAKPASPQSASVIALADIQRYSRSHDVEALQDATMSLFISVQYGSNVSPDELATERRILVRTYAKLFRAIDSAYDPAYDPKRKSADFSVDCFRLLPEELSCNMALSDVAPDKRTAYAAALAQSEVNRERYIAYRAIYDIDLRATAQLRLILDALWRNGGAARSADYVELDRIIHSEGLSASRCAKLDAMLNEPVDGPAAITYPVRSVGTELMEMTGLLVSYQQQRRYGSMNIRTPDGAYHSLLLENGVSAESIPLRCSQVPSITLPIQDVICASWPADILAYETTVIVRYWNLSLLMSDGTTTTYQVASSFVPVPEP